MALVAGGCGGSSDAGEAAAPNSTASTTTSVINEQRPEGPWTFVRTTLTRDGEPSVPAGDARVSLAKVIPTCGDGPCDLNVTPAGVGGSYRPEGMVASESATPTATVAAKPATYVWDAPTSAYTVVDKVAKDSCTNAEGKTIQDVYSTTTTTTFTFHPATDDRPAAIIGSFTNRVEATDAGLADGCTPFEDAGTIVGAPTGSLSADDARDLTGSYVATEVVTKTEPSGGRPPGFRGVLGRFEMTVSGDGYALGGFVGEVTLARAGAGYSGSSGEFDRPCPTTPETPAGFSTIEEFTDLTVIALTEEGDPILAGGWSLSDDPTPAGVEAGCSFGSNMGYVILVPAASAA